MINECKKKKNTGDNDTIRRRRRIAVTSHPDNRLRGKNKNTKISREKSIDPLAGPLDTVQP